MSGRTWGAIASLEPSQGTIIPKSGSASCPICQYPRVPYLTYIVLVLLFGDDGLSLRGVNRDT